MDEYAEVLGIAGSPRTGGNTESMLETVLDAAAESGASIDMVRLGDLSFSGCVGCEQCRITKTCTRLKDDLSPLYPRIDRARALVLASPAYNYNVSWPMKAFIDRLYCYYDFTDDHPRGFSSRLAHGGRIAGIVAVCEQTFAVGMGQTVSMMQMPLEALGYRIAGIATAELAFEKGAVLHDDDAMFRARQLGALIGKTVITSG